MPEMVRVPSSVSDHSALPPHEPRAIILCRGETNIKKLMQTPSARIAAIIYIAFLFGAFFAAAFSVCLFSLSAAALFTGCFFSASAGFDAASKSAISSPTVCMRSFTGSARPLNRTSSCAGLIFTPRAEGRGISLSILSIALTGV